MSLPFTHAQFVEVFEQYNSLIWPLQPVTLALGLLASIAVFVKRGSARLSRAVNALVAVFWLIAGLGYMLHFFTRLAPMGYVLAPAFALEGALLAHAAWRKSLVFEPRRNLATLLGAAIVAYGVVVYPLIGLAVGRAPVASPWLGTVPCPTTITTLGLLLLARPPVAKRFAIIPFLWGLVGVVPALALGIPEDLGMTVAALVVGAAMFLPRRTTAAAATRPALS